VNQTIPDKLVHGFIARVTQPPMPKPLRGGRHNNSTILINIKSKNWVMVCTIQTAIRVDTWTTGKLVDTITGGRKRPEHIRVLSGSATKTIKRNLAVMRVSHSIYRQEIHRTVGYVEYIC